MKFLAILSLVVLSALGNVYAAVPMRIEENVFSSYYYADYDQPTGEPQREGDWWGTSEYSLTNEADDASGTAPGTFIALDDADDLSWGYYSDNTLPVHSNGAVNVVIKYYGCGTNMVQGTIATDLGISPVVANDGGDNVKAIFYRKTIEKDNTEDAYYTYTAIPNPFSRRPVRTDTDVMTGTNCKFLGFYGWAAEWNDCSLAYVDGTSFDGNSYAETIVLPGKKLKVTVTGSNPTITFKALWDQCVVQTVVGTTVTTTGMVTASDAVGYATLYERQYNVCLNTTTFTAKNFPVTFSQLYPDGTDGGYYNDTPQNITAVTPVKTSSIDNKFEYMNFTGTNLQKIVSTITNNNSYYARFVIGRGMNMPNPVNFIGISQNTSNYNMRFAQGMDVRVESGNYTYIKAMTNTAGVESASNQRASQSMYNVDGALSHFVLGSDFDRWQNNNTRLVSSGNVVLFDGIKFAEHSAKVQIDVLSGTFGTNSYNDFYMGMQSMNYEHLRYANTNSYPYLRMVSDRYITMLGGVINASFYGGHDENKENTGTSQPTVAVGGDGYAWTNANAVDVSSNYVVFKMKGGTLNGDFYGGDNVRFSEGGSNRIEITAQPRRIAFVGGTVNGTVYGGSKYDDASSASTMTDNTHMSALALTDVDMYVGGSVALGSNIVYGGDNNVANSNVKTLHSVRNVNIVVSDGITVESVYGGGEGAGLGKNYNWESFNPRSNVNIVLKNATVENSVFGGIHDTGGSSADYIYGSTNITIDGGMYNVISGGGHGGDIHGLLGSTTVTLNDGFVAEIYGGGDNSSVGQYISDLSTININGGTVYNVFGGGWRGVSYSSPVINVNGGSILGDVYGGACGGYSDYEDVVYTRGLRTVNVGNNANIEGNVYGGSLNCIDLEASTKDVDVELTSSQNRDFGLYHRWGGKGFNAALINSELVGAEKVITSLSFPYLMSSWKNTWNNSNYFPVVRTIKVYLYNINSDSELLTQSNVLKVNDETGECYMQFTSTAANVSASQGNLDWKVDADHKVFDGDVTINYHDEAMVVNLDNPFLYDGTSHLLICIETTNSTKTTIGSNSDETPSLPLLASITNENPHKYGSMVIGGGNSSITSWETTKPSDQTNGGAYTPIAQIPVVHFGSTPVPELAPVVPVAFVNVTKGNIGGSVFGSGDNNKMYGGCYVNIGANAVENAPGHAANVNALETLTPGAINIGGSVYAGSNATGSWSYADADRSISGVSEVYLDGTGYDGAITIGSGGGKTASAGNIYGCSTNGEGGKLGSSVYISNIGARNAEGKNLSSTTYSLNSVQHADTLVLNNAHVTFNGAQQLEGSATNSIYGIHKIMRLVNNSTALLKADADSIAKVGSYHCDDVYADNPVYTEVTAVSGASGKTQLADCKNTIVFTEGANLYIRTMESGSETYGELQGYLYAHNTENFNMAQARARQKQTDYSDIITGGTDYATDGGFVSYDELFNTYDNPTTDGYDGTGGKQEIAFRNVSSTPAYREWNVDNLVEVNLYAEKNTGGTYTSEAITLPATAGATWYMYATPGSQGGVYPNGGLVWKKNSSFNLVPNANVDDLDLGITVEAAAADGWSSAIDKDLVTADVLPGGTSTSYASIGTTPSTSTTSDFKFVLHFDDEYSYDGDTLGYAIVRMAPASGGVGQNCIKIWFLTIDPDAVPHLWTEAVTSFSQVPEGGFVVDNDGNVTINCEEGFAWLISYVNGLNGSDPHTLEGKTVTITKPLINMSEYIWVPIGYDTEHPFKGTFDGGSNVLCGVHIDQRQSEIDYVENKYGPMVYAGMFGYTDGATVKNTTLLIGETHYHNDHITGKQTGGYLGALVAYGKDLDMELCYMFNGIVAWGALNSIGGLVGHAEGGGHAIKACMACAHLTFDEDHPVESLGGIVGSTGAGYAVTDCFAAPVDLSLKYANESMTEWGVVTNMGAVVGSGTATSNVYVHPLSLTEFTAVDGGTAPANSYWYALEDENFDDVTEFTEAVPRTYGSYPVNNTVNGRPLADVLNDHVTPGYKWMTPPSTDINMGYPVIVKESDEGYAYFVAADPNQHFLYVVRSGLDKLWTVLSEFMSKSDNPFGEKAGESGMGTYMYSNGDIGIAVPAIMNLYIDENVALTQSTTDEVNANVGITIKNPHGNGDEDRDWHTFATSLKQAPLGIKYCEADQSHTGYAPGSDNFLVFGPEGALSYDYAIDADGYFPAGIADRTQFDFYSYYEPEYHWINLKRKANNHWHEDEVEGLHPQINYDGESGQTYLEKGKGYLVGLGTTTDNNNYMQAQGVLTNGVVKHAVTAAGSNFKGYNLLGNPYQSYLDFNEFASVNEKVLWGEGNTTDTGYMAYLIFDAANNRFEQYLVDPGYVGFSHGAATTTSRYLNMHQGFFVVKRTEDPASPSAPDSVVFNNDMRVITANAASYRSEEQPAYPLVNLFCTDSDGNQEIVIMELERPLKAGSLKMKGMLNGKANMYAHWGNDDLGAVFIDYMPDYVPVWFDAAEDGVFTITWSTANENFGYMHLIDNIAGVDYDCLAPGNDHYTFHANVNDMSARFRLVFKPLGIEEETIGNGENFAFFNGNELVVNGEGELSLIDLNGRVLQTQYVAGQQSVLAMPKVAVGMYMLRLSNANDVKVQKIVIRK